jgi:hypothetical protein
MSAHLRQWLRRLWCVGNGGHEFYIAREGSRLFQRCLLCRHETCGWDVTARVVR